MASKLYDRSSDPYELVDIASKSPEVIERLVRTELLPWLKKRRILGLKMYRSTDDSRAGFDKEVNGV